MARVLYEFKWFDISYALRIINYIWFYVMTWEWVEHSDFLGFRSPKPPDGLYRRNSVWHPLRCGTSSRRYGMNGHSRYSLPVAEDFNLRWGCSWLRLIGHQVWYIIRIYLYIHIYLLTHLFSQWLLLRNDLLSSLIHTFLHWCQIKFI